ncbi:glycosyltransferase involved in cell wall biosynthesis [Thiogranum longum]|uniref:Glycosyltransferase involved in cell wall biosynthesis n=1 Tax=Thiogranum longum TaxID=1537524 RepID=A0A4R1HJ10_9GAMM|nr:glycosyltransferase family 4 protein [Thiogranum longum]TCK19479.1 glycosyltransferase involved in cell wall biosynthesis [Thiogranum longum]
MAENKKTIAYIVPMGAGLETFVYREIDALFNKGRKLFLFATKYRKGDVFGPKEDWSFRTLTPLELLIRSPIIALRALLHPGLLVEAARDRALVDLVFALDYAPVMKRNNIAQIHCHHGDHKLFVGYFCKKLTNLPLSVTIHAAEFYTNPNPSLFRKAVRYCDGVFPISRKWYDLLKNDYGVDESRIHLNRLFVDVSLYRPVSRVNILSVGRFTERKGFQYLLEAIGKLQDVDAHFCFVGFGDMDLQHLAEELRVSDRVTIFSKMNQEELRFLYQSVDILCVPSITTQREGAEGIPVVLMEGMACGLPVVATRCGAIDEIVDQIIVDERSSGQLASALRKLIENPELRKDLGKRNREYVEQNYSEKNVDRFEEGLDLIANEK